MMWRGLIFIINIILLLGVTNSFLISEVQYQNNEFIEIFSEDFINFSNATIYDENGNSRPLLQMYYNNNSNFTIIGGSNFIETLNITNYSNCSRFNCSNIYFSGYTEITNYGLLKKGEDITIELSNGDINNLEIEEELDFKNSNETYQYFFGSGGYKIANKSIFFIRNESHNISLNETNLTTINQTVNVSQNLSQNISSNATNSTNNSEINEFIYFKIISENDIIEDKIEYKFDTNAEDFTIEYWIEDFGGEIVKAKRNTTNTGKKTYTPNVEITSIYVVKGKLYYNEEIIENSTKIVFSVSSVFSTFFKLPPSPPNTSFSL
jgi:hypothetical protein